MQKTQLTWDELNVIRYSLYSDELDVAEKITEARSKGGNTEGLEITLGNLRDLKDKVKKMMSEINEETWDKIRNWKGTN